MKENNLEALTPTYFLLIIIVEKSTLQHQGLLNQGTVLVIVFLAIRTTI